MAKDIKILFGAIALTLILILGFALWQSGRQPEEVFSNQAISGLEVTPPSYELGNVPIKGGIVTKDYEVKNTTDKVLKLKKITTSCMCTTASFQVGSKETRFFGMEMVGDKNPPVNIEVAPGQTGKVQVRFDPAAHGPEGVGPFDRIVWLAFSDPAGVTELKFNGTVVSQ